MQRSILTAVFSAVFTAVFAIVFAACSTTPTPESGAPVEDRAAASAAPGAATSGTTGGNIAGTATRPGQGNPLRDPNSPLSKRSVYFDFDSYAVRDEYKPLIEAHGRYLQGTRPGKMIIQGNTDERGSREYNIALGQRRADAVKKMMMLFGATESQIETVSFGKEKPKNPGHDENAWTENRRDDFVYQGE
jgi:peptidoglycan-associated lipoprotein